MCDADQEFECNFGFVGADSANGRVCVPYTPAEEVCGNDGQDVCAGVGCLALSISHSVFFTNEQVDKVASPRKDNLLQH